MPKSMGQKKKPMASASEPRPKYVCPHCGELKSESQFYKSSDPAISIGIAFPCKSCAEKIARNYNENYKTFGDCTAQSVQAALEYLDKPFIQTIYDASYNEVNDPTLKQPKTNLWAAYIKNIQMYQYKTMRWRDGDLFKDNCSENKVESEEKKSANMNPEVLDEYKTNKRDVIRLIGYDPFANYSVEQDLPVLYAQLINFIDEETKNDGMKMNAVIQIVQAFNQIQKLNDAINELSADTKKLNTNNGTIKQHADTISKLLSGANALAKDNGINIIVPA